MCVCKSWQSLIKDPIFIDTHLKRTHQQLLLLRVCSEEHERYLLHFDNQDFNEYMQLDFPFRSFNDYFRVVGSCNGLLCLVDDLYIYTNTFILWNPMIRKSITLPKPSITYKTHGPFEAFVGFGFDSRANDYKVLRIVHLVKNTDTLLHDDDEQLSEPKIEAELYSLKKCCWKSIPAYAPKYIMNERMRPAFVNGIVHWIAYKKGRNFSFTNLILGFDMVDEVFNEIMLPRCLSTVEPHYLSVWEYKESSVAVAYLDYDPVFCYIWVMMEYGEAGSWQKLFSIERERYGLSMPWVLGFKKNGGVLLEKFRGWIAGCDPGCNESKDLGIQGEEYFIFVGSFVETMVLLDRTNDENVIDDAVAKNSANSTTHIRNNGYVYYPRCSCDAVDNSYKFYTSELSNQSDGESDETDSGFNWCY